MAKRTWQRLRRPIRKFRAVSEDRRSRNNVIRFPPTQPPMDGERRIYVLEAGNLSETAEALERILLSADAPIFRHSGRLVCPHVDTSATNGRLPRASLRMLDVHTVQELVSRYVRVQKFDARRKRPVDTDLPKDIAALLCERAVHGTLHEIVGIINAPTLGADWSVLDQPGYDMASGLYLAAPPSMKSVLDHPTREDALDALALLKDLFREFQFANAESCSVALSLLIASVCCGAISIMPLHGLSASSPGTGKTYLAQMASLIAYGHETPVIAANENPEELRKQLTAVLLSGDRFVLLDNINGELESSLLCQAVELRQVSVRELGSSKNTITNGGAAFVVTGNNLQISGDLTRRSVLCELVRDEERPELHVFLDDPKAKIMADRGRYVWACLTILRAYIAAGKPNLLPPIASFGDWNIVRCALTWLGEADSASSMKTIRELDDKRTEFEVLVLAIDELDLGFDGFTGQELVASSSRKDAQALRAALEAVALTRDGINVKRLGALLRSNKGRVFSVTRPDGSTVRLKLEGKIGHGKVARWRFVEL